MNHTKYMLSGRFFNAPTLKDNIAIESLFPFLRPLLEITFML
jgi:hypothetical protein